MKRLLRARRDGKATRDDYQESSPGYAAAFKSFNAVKTLVFIFGLCISAVGAVDILAPSVLVAVAQQFVTAGAFYVLAAVRIAFGLILISVSSASRVPKALRLLGYVIVMLGITTALTGLMALGPARGVIDWWLQQAPGVLRLTAGLVLALGVFVAYACAPMRRFE
jgi:hypothetical protein